MSDIIFGIGGDNTDLERSNEESLRMIERWVADVQSAVDEVEPPSFSDEPELVIDSLISKLEELKGVKSSLKIDTSSVQEAIAELEDLKKNASDLSQTELNVLGSTGGAVDQIKETIGQLEKQKEAVEQVRQVFADFNTETDKSKLEKRLQDAVSGMDRLGESGEKVRQIFADFNAEAGNADLERKFIEAGQALGGWDDEIAQAEKAVQDMLKSVGRLVGIIGTVGGTAIAVYNTVLDWEHAASGFNDELERGKQLEQDLLSLAKERLSLRRQQIAKEQRNNDGESETLERVKEDLETAKADVRNAQAALQAAKAGKADADKTAKQFEQTKNPLEFAFGFIFAPLARNERNQFEEKEKQADENLKKQKEKLKQTEELARQAEEKGAERKAKSQEQLNKQLEREISLREEAALRAEGKTDEANGLRTKRERSDDLDRFKDLGDGAEDATDKAAASRVRQRNAEAAKEKQKQNEDDEKDRERIENRIGGLRRRQADQETRDARRIEDFALRRKKITEETKSILGGFDSGLASAADRIGQAANSTSGRDRQVEQLEALNRATERAKEDSKRQRDRIADAIEAQTTALEKINTGMT